MSDRYPTKISSLRISIASSSNISQVRNSKILISSYSKQYEDVKDEIDAFVEEARDRALTDYPITSEKDVLRYYDETCRGHENDPDVDIQEGRKRFEDDQLGMLHQLLDTMSDNWYECDGYYFMVGVW